MAIGVIIGSVFWLTYRIDRLERESAEKLVELMVTERVSNLARTVADYAYWDSAYEMITTQNDRDMDGEIGAAAVSEGIFSHILILAPDGEGLYLYDESGRVDNFDLTELQPFLVSLRQTAPGDKITISGIGAIDDGYGAVSAAYVTPTYISDLGGQPLPIFIGIKMFTDDALQAIVKLTHGTGYAVNSVKSSSNGPVVPLIGPDGTPIAQLVWTPSKVGSVLRREIMPGILLVCAGIFGICVSAARYFYRQSAALETAVTFATTDRLTGLLNRAGLDEVLRRPETIQDLEWGKMAVIYIDLNDFKKMNDVHGHKVGDLALKSIAGHLKEAVRSTDQVIRLGGDEFVCIIRDPDPESAARAVSERLLLACSVPIKLTDIEIVLSPAMGISVAGICATWDTLLAQADTAMFQAKRNKQRSALLFSSPVPKEKHTRPAKIALG